MGEWAEFRPGDKAPKNAVYREVGEKSFHTEVTNPKSVQLQRGDTFPETTNHNRKWKEVDRD